LNAHSVAIAKLLPCLRMDRPACAFGKEDQLTTAWCPPCGDRPPRSPRP